MKPAIKTGAVMGTGGAINVELGWVPTYVKVVAADSAIVTEAFLTWYMPFTSGGTAQIVGGSSIRGVTSRATANVREVFLASGAWSLGTAVGWLALEEGSLVGTFGGEDVVVTNLASGQLTTAAGGDATVTANVVQSISAGASTQAASAANAGLYRYEGTVANYSKGFTIGSTLSVAGSLIRFAAFRENT